jgi:hypothetical protein
MNPGRRDPAKALGGGSILADGFLNSRGSVARPRDRVPALSNHTTPCCG